MCQSIITECPHDSAGTLASWLIKLKLIVRQVNNINFNAKLPTRDC